MVKAIMIVEMAGHPAEHVKESLEKHVSVLRQIKDIEVNSITISDPKEIEGSEGMFTCFAEVDFGSESFSRLSEIMFDFMPSSVEVVEPAKISLDAQQATALLNNISGRMHRYDEVAMMAQGKVRQISEQLRLAYKILVDKGIYEVKDGKLIPASGAKHSEKKTAKKVAKKAEKKTHKKESTKKEHKAIVKKVKKVSKKNIKKSKK